MFNASILKLFKAIYNSLELFRTLKVSSSKEQRGTSKSKNFARFTSFTDCNMRMFSNWFGLFRFNLFTT